MDMNFVGRYMRFIMHVSLFLSGEGCREASGRLLIASPPPKKTRVKDGINRGEGDYAETPNPRCTQFGNIARCHGNAALPQSQSPHAERRRQPCEREANNVNTSCITQRQEKEMPCKVRCRGITCLCVCGEGWG